MKPTATLSALLVGTILLGALAAEARTADEVRAACRAEGRPCVGLVLSGGGARGFAHVGVLQVLEELGVRIDVVAGTSMGSMVGGAYAAGYTPKEIEGIVLGVDWDKMLAPRTDRAKLPWREKESDYRGLSSGGIEITSEGRFRLPEGLVPSQELALFLQTWTGRVDMVKDLSALPIPFAAPATDLVKGERVVMQKGCTLGEAMRASMSVPGAFAPLEHGGTLLVDGGLVDNLPVELAREMGADVVIAVNVGTPLSGRDRLQSVVGVMAQMVNLLTEQNVRTSLEALRPGDILITPELGELSSADLKKSPLIIEAGRRAALASRASLEKLAARPEFYTAWDARRREVIRETETEDRHVLAAVRVDGRTTLDAERIVRSADLPLGVPLTRGDVEEGTRRVWSEGYYSSVSYRFEPGPDGTQVLVLEPREKRDRYSTVRIGGSVETDFNDNNHFTAVFSHTWHLINAWGGSWKNEVQMGDDQYFRSEFYQPLGSDTAWFLRPSLEFSREKYDVYDGGEAVASDRSELFDAKLLLGYDLERYGFAGLQTGYIRQKARRLVGADLRGGTQTFESPYAGGILFVDTLDNIDFPTSGLRIGLQGYVTKEDDEGEAEAEHYYLAEFCWPLSWNAWTLTTNLELGRSTRRGAFLMGGAQKMIGTDYGRWVGSRMEYGRVTLSRNMSDVFDIGFPVWMGTSVESGRAWNPKDDARLESGRDERHRAASVYAGVDSPLGPLYLMFGKTHGEGSAVYFVWGHRN